MTIRHYDHRHNTVAEVRACSYRPIYTPQVANQTNRVVPIRDRYPASDKARGYLRDLIAKRESDDADGRIYETIMDALGGKTVWADEARAAIKWLLSQPHKPRPAGETASPARRLGMPDVPAGRYCLERNGELKFYQVDRPTEGRWAGFTFVKQLIGAPGDYRKIRFTKEQARPILEEIAKDPRAASSRYGMESGVCGVCSSPLTNAESLAYGIGPICRAKRGW